MIIYSNKHKYKLIFPSSIIVQKIARLKVEKLNSYLKDDK